MQLLGHKTMDTHSSCARALNNEIQRTLEQDEPVQVDDIALLAKGALGDLAQVWAAATIGRDLTTSEGAVLVLAAQRAVWEIITGKEWAES